MSTRDILSEGELDALMDSVSGDDALPGDPGSGKGCQPFDFSTREQTVLAQMPALKHLNEKQALDLAEGFRALYKIPAEVQAVESSLLRLDQALAGIEDPSGINLVKAAPLNGTSYVVIPANLLSFVVDRYFGGGQAAAPANSVRVSLSRSEQRVNDVLVDKFLSTLVDAWREKVELVPAVTSVETSPAFLQAGSPDDLALLFSFSVKVGEWKSSIDWLVPYAMLEPLRSKLGSSVDETSQAQKNSDWEDHFRRELQFVKLEVSGSFTPEHVSIADVLSFKPGSIVPLKVPTEVVFCVESEPFSHGEHGVLNGHKSIKIKEMINDTENR